jgi:hypothetical protein
VAQAELDAGEITQAEFQMVTGGLVNPPPPSTAGGSCTITGCKVPKAFDPITGSAYALLTFPGIDMVENLPVHELMMCSTCVDGHPDFGGPGSKCDASGIGGQYGCQYPVDSPTLECGDDGVWLTEYSTMRFEEPVCVGKSTDSGNTIENAISYAVASQWPKAYPPKSHYARCHDENGADIPSEQASPIDEASCVAGEGTWFGGSCEERLGMGPCDSNNPPPCSFCSTAQQEQWAIDSAVPWAFCHGGYGDVCEYECAPGYRAEGVHKLRFVFGAAATFELMWHGGSCVSDNPSAEPAAEPAEFCSTECNEPNSTGGTCYDCLAGQPHACPADCECDPACFGESGRR